MRPDAQWCSLCYLDLRPAPEPVAQVPISPVTLAPAVPSALPSEQPAIARPGATDAPAGTDADAAVAPSSSAGWPCPDCSTVVALEFDVCPACGAAFLARLADHDGRHRAEGGPGMFARLPRTARLVVGTVLGMLLAVLVPVLLALFG